MDGSDFTPTYVFWRTGSYPDQATKDQSESGIDPFGIAADMYKLTILSKIQVTCGYKLRDYINSFVERVVIPEHFEVEVVDFGETAADVEVINKDMVDNDNNLTGLIAVLRKRYEDMQVRNIGGPTVSMP